MWTRTLALVNRAHRLADRRDLPAPTKVEVDTGRARGPLLHLGFDSLAALTAWADDLGISVPEATVRGDVRHLVLFGISTEFEGTTIELSCYERVA